MPFWESVKRCENCEHFSPHDPSDDYGICNAPRPKGLPFWAEFFGKRDVQREAGTDCTAYRHNSKPAHPLDDAPAVVMAAQVGDFLPMRTYSRGDVSIGEAKVVKHTQNFCVVDFHNTRHRIRYLASDRQMAGTVIGMEDWGVDMEAPVRRATFKRHNPARAPRILRDVKPGDMIQLIGMPPFEGITKQVKVLHMSSTHLRIKLGRGTERMVRKGPQAGLLEENPMWVLDTTENRDAEQTEETPGAAQAAEGSPQI